MTLDATRQKLEWLEGQVWAKRKWIEASLKKQWPAHDREAKQYDLEMLESLVSDYRRVEARYQEQAA